MKDLTVLTLSHTGVDGSGLRHLVGSRLEGLDLGHTSVTDIAMEHVGQLPNLEWLLLNDTDISDSGASKLVGIDSLRILAVNDTRISDESLRVFSRFEKLEWLSLLRTTVSETGVLELQASLPNCRIVWRDEQRTVLDKVRSLDGRVGLKPNDALLPQKIPDDIREIFADVIRITVRSQDFGDEDMKRLETFSELKHLNIAATAVSENGLQELLGQSTKLEYVTLANPRITDSVLMVIQNLPNLKSLSIANTRISDSGLAMLREVENLEVLHINSQLITDEGIEYLGSVEALKELSLDFSKGIEGLKFESLMKLKRLEELSLSNTRIDDRSIGGLSKLKQLKSLSVGGTDISTSGVAAIRANLPSTRVMHWANSDPVRNATAEP
jgi:Leucine-rich repeat (LRR) protein